MDLVVDAGILADAALETGFNYLADQLHRHPALAALPGIDQSLGCGLRAHLGNDAVKIVIALRNADEASHLADAIASSADDRDARRDRVGLAHADRRAGDASD